MLSEALRSATHMRCVPVIASFSTNGEILPLYLKINSTQLKIVSCVMEKQDKENVWGTNVWIVFRCVVIDNNTQKQIQLSYQINEHAWFVPSEYFR